MVIRAVGLRNGRNYSTGEVTGTVDQIQIMVIQDLVSQARRAHRMLRQTRQTPQYDTSLESS